MLSKPVTLFYPEDIFFPMAGLPVLALWHRTWHKTETGWVADAQTDLSVAPQCHDRCTRNARAAVAIRQLRDRSRLSLETATFTDGLQKPCPICGLALRFCPS